jgi:hypothetical protein
MFEHPSVVSLEKKGGPIRRCDRAGHGAGECQSGQDERFSLLLTQAADLFVKSQIHQSAPSDLIVADWLTRSPCHECAWRRVRAAWDVLPALL